MKIKVFDPKFAGEMAELFAAEYSEGGERRWSAEKAGQFLEVCYKYFPEYCLMATDDEGNCMGAIFSLVNPYYSGDVIFVQSVQVKPEYRRRGVGKALLAKTKQLAREKGMSGIRLLTDERKDFPRRWYERLGFVKSGYTEYEAGLDNVKI